VYVVVTGIAVDGRNPAQATSACFGFQASDRRLRERDQIQTFGALRRDDQARNRTTTIGEATVASLVGLRLGVCDRAGNELGELFALFASEGALGSEKFRPRVRPVAVGDVLEQT